VNPDVLQKTDVVELVPVAGTLFVVRWCGGVLRIDEVARRDPPAPGSGTVVPFPARGR